VAHPHPSTVVVPGKENVRGAGHNTHALAPANEYAPAGHATQTVELLAPETPENEPAGHETHALALVAPVTFEYAPAEQFVHAVAPAAAYDPTAQGTHTPLTLR
jgi:hypothetical protein